MVNPVAGNYAAGSSTARNYAVVAHRGASGYLPEHTLAAYELGIRQGADAFEIDVVPTRDGHLVARHENDLTGSTDVRAHPEFADGRITKEIAGLRHTGWFAEDFTLAELATLRAIEPLPGVRSTEHDGRYAVPTLPEILALRARLSMELGREVGLKLEVKTPEHFATIGVPMTQRLLADLADADMLGAGSPVEIMTFEPHFLRALREQGVGNRLVALIEDEPGRPVPGEAGTTYGELCTRAGLARLRESVEAIGPGRYALFGGAPGTPLGEPSPLFANAKAAGLRLDCWTFRAENAFLPTDFQRGEDPAAYGDLGGLVAAYVHHGLATVITDQPREARRAAPGDGSAVAHTSQ